MSGYMQGHEYEKYIEVSQMNAATPVLSVIQSNAQTTNIESWHEISMNVLKKVIQTYFYCSELYGR